MAESWRNLGYVYRQEGNYQQASQCFENSVSICLEHGLDKYEAFYCAGLLALYCNNYALAARRFTHQLNLTRRPGRQGNAGALLLGLAAVAAGTNRPEHAATLFGAAQTLCEMTGDRTPTLDRAEFERHIQIAREQLGEEQFEAGSVKGRAMTLDQTLDLALHETK